MTKKPFHDPMYLRKLQLDYNYICPMGAFDYTTNCNNACPLMQDCLWWGLVKVRHELTHNTPEYLQTCHKINNSIVSYKKIFNRFIFHDR